MRKAVHPEVVTLDELDFAVYISAEDIEHRIAEMATQISQDYKDKNPLLLIVLNGAFIFGADLIRHIDINVEPQFIRLKSYDKLSSTENLHISGMDLIDVKDRDVIIIEDIVDSGYSMHHFMPMLHEKGATSVALTTLLHKPTAQKYDVSIDYIGFKIPPQFVVGYGLDYNEKGRNLPQIYQLIDLVE